MRPQTMMIGALALILAGSAAVWTKGMMNSKAGAPAPEMITVVVANVDMTRGGMITPEMVQVREFPKGLVPMGALTKLEDAIDRTIGVPISKDEPLLEAKLSPKGSGRGMAALIPKGMRAFTITTPTLASGVAGFILPGNKVDVLLTITDGGDSETGGGSTTTLLQKVEILAVDQRTDAPAENKVDANLLRSVTLVVNPSQAKQLDLGQNRGMLHLSLRNPDDQERDVSTPATLRSIQFRQEKPWDVRAKSVLESLGKALAQAKPPAPPAPVPAPTPEPEPAPAPPAASVAAAPEGPRPVFIRTLRGLQEGGAYVYPPSSTLPSASTAGAAATARTDR